jgi:acetyl esterase/lipase
LSHLPRPVVRALAGATYRLFLNRRVPVRVQRAATEAGGRLAVPPRGTSVDLVRLGGRPAERVRLGPAAGPSAVLYLHGGGYVIGSPRMYRSLAAHLSRAAGAEVFTLDYRLAPEHRFPAALDDALAAFGELVDRYGFAPGKLALAGDSAGGGLAVALARRLVDAGRAPAALALLSPWLDPCDADMPRRDFVIDREWGRRCADSYLGTGDPSDPGYAPLRGSLRDLPPTLVHFSATEVLGGQIRRFAAAARAAGVAVETHESRRVWHSGQQLAGVLREATDEVAAIGAFLRGHLSAATAASR